MMDKDGSSENYMGAFTVPKTKLLMIKEITDAKIEDGGGGAFYIFLKKNKSIK